MKTLFTIIGVLYSFAGISQIVDIPDPNFKNALLNHDPVIDINGDGEIQVAEAEATLEIDVDNQSISSLEGIGAFINLEELKCNFNNLTSIDIPNNLSLRSLYASSNQLSEINISQNTILEELSIRFNNLIELDISNNLELELLQISQNEISEVDITNHNSLRSIQIGGGTENLISEIDLTNKPFLDFLSIFRSEITEIDISDSPLLFRLSIFNTPISNLDISNNLQLGNLNIVTTLISQIDLSSHVNLYSIDLNNNELSSIDVSNNTEIIELIVSNNQLSEIDVSQNINLTNLAISNNILNTVDLSNNTLLESLAFNRSSVTNLDLSNNLQLQNLSIWETQIEEIDLSNLEQLQTLRIDNSAIRILDLSNNPICNLRADNNLQLEYVNLKNGFNTSFDPEVGCVNSGFPSFTLENCPNLQFVCVDDIVFAQEFMVPVPPQTAYVDDCSLINGDLNRIEGIVTYDEMLNGCDSNDVTPEGILVNTTNGDSNFANTSDSSGFYTIPVGEGDFTTTILGLPDYFSFTPDTSQHNFTGFDQTETIDFCIQPTSTVQDLSVSLAPINDARPGFDAIYTLTYENLGTTAINNAQVILVFDDNRIVFDEAMPAPNSQTTNSLTWDIGTIDPFAIGSIEIHFDVFAPPANVGGEILEFITTLDPMAGDATPENNTFTLEQEIVNSFDPNDITVLEGSEVLIDDADQFLHYLIRFQNTGTASAINVRVQNELEEQLDWTTFRLLGSSHEVDIQLINQQIDFVFDNINLPDETTDPEGSQGYILYEIKPINDVVIGDVVENTAAIFFDFNAPITTNTTATTFVEPLAIESFIAQNFDVYPNPTSDILNISGTIDVQEMNLYNLNGKKIQSIKNEGRTIQLIVRDLKAGLYFIQLFTDDGLVTKRFIKN